MPRSRGSSTTTEPRRRGGSGPERGSAIAEFVMVAALVALVCSAVIQVAFTFHVRTVLIDAAGEGARVGALAGNSLHHGQTRTRYLIEAALPASYAQSVSANYVDLDGLPIVSVQVQAPLPLIGFLGPRIVTVSGRAVAE